MVYNFNHNLHSMILVFFIVLQKNSSFLLYTILYFIIKRQMSRTFLKNSLYYYATHNEQKKKRQQQQEKERQQLQIAQARDADRQKKNLSKLKSNPQMADFNANEALRLEVHEQQQQQPDLNDQLKKLFANANSSRKQQQRAGVGKKVAFIPKSSLKPVESNEQYNKQQLSMRQQWERQRKQKQQMWKLRQELIKAMKIQNKQPNGAANGQEKGNDLQKTNQKQGKDEVDEKDGKEKAKTTGKKKKIKKQANYVKTDLKRRYRDRFVGGVNKNLRMLTKGGKMKSFYKSKLQSQLQISQGEVYNSYIISLSKALFVTIKLEDSDEQGQGQEQQKLNYEIPTIYSKQNLQKLIKDLFGFTSFREGQFQTISNILNAKSTLFVSETASGKSLTYLLASVILKGLSIVVSPLVSLMLDQIDHLPSDLPAACISSLLNHEQKDRIIKMVKQGRIQILYITPQSFLTDFMYHVRQFPPINFVCIDQAHSLSQLSHSFRASYLSLQSIILKSFKYKTIQPVVLCLTATANIETMQSICEKLNIKQTIRSKSVINKNLFVTISREGLSAKFQGVLNYLQHKQIRKCKGILIYCRTKKNMYEVFHYLRNSGELCFIYHSGLPQKEKVQTLEKFRRGTIRIVIATIALGMGLDFENLQCVIHINMPKSVQNYIQEIGRAGRRNKRAYCHLFLDKYDYYTERNYFLADELEPKIFESIIEILKTNFVQGKKRIDRKKDQLNNQDQTQNLKRLSLDEHHIFQQEEQYSQKQQNSKNELDAEQNDDQMKKIAKQIIEQKLKQQKAENGIQQNNEEVCEDSIDEQLLQFLPFAYCKADLITEKSGLKQQAILNILLKIQKHLGKTVFKVLPMSSQTLKLSLFKKNEQTIRKQHPFYCKLTQNTKNIKGTFYIPLIKKCNQLKITPIRLLSEVYGISNKYCLKIQLINQIFVWQHQKSAEYTFKLLMDKQHFQTIMRQFNLVQRTALTKFNIFYSLAFDNSMKSMFHILQKNQIVSDKDPLPHRSILNSFDQYFKQQTYKFYHQIANESKPQQKPSQIQTQNQSDLSPQDQSQKLKGQQQQNKIIEAEYLPITSISPQNLIQIQQNVQLFLKHVMMNNPDKKFVDIMMPYRDGRTIARVFLGVNDTNSNWKIYGEHPYWMKFVDKDYRQLLKTVRSCVTDFVARQGPRILSLQQNCRIKSSKKAES